MIVVDTNVLVYSFVDGPMTAAAKRALRAQREIVVPPRWRSEFRSALLSHVRTGSFSIDAAIRAFRRAERFVSEFEEEPDPRRVLVAATRYPIDAYDAEFVALGEECECPVLTGDYKSLADRLPAHMTVRLSYFV